MGTRVFHDSIGVFVGEGDNSLFSRWAFCCNLDLPSFDGRFVECCIVNLDDFLIWEGRESFLYF